MVGCRILLKNKADWLSTLLHSKFFDTCGDHRDLRKSEKNVFCIDCNLCFCKHCVTSSGHCLHRRLKICKYVYHDVVRLQDMQQHLDCSKIQTYKINGEKAVHLNPRPQSKDCKASKPKGGASCEACGRYIQDLPNRFCSIACKVLIFAEKFKDHNSKVVPYPVQEFAHLSLKESVDMEENLKEKELSSSLADSPMEIETQTSSALKPKKQLHKRKGIPRRSPLF